VWKLSYATEVGLLPIQREKCGLTGLSDMIGGENGFEIDRPAARRRERFIRRDDPRNYEESRSRARPNGFGNSPRPDQNEGQRKRHYDPYQ
jgi:hypothetical protein